MTIQVKLLKRWGEYKIGDVVTFDARKGLPLVKAGVGEMVDSVMVIDKPVEAVDETIPDELPCDEIETATVEVAEDVEVADSKPRRQWKRKK